jgi:hypothetical protein
MEPGGGGVSSGELSALLLQPQLLRLTSVGWDWGGGGKRQPSAHKQEGWCPAHVCCVPL